MVGRGRAKTGQVSMGIKYIQFLSDVSIGGDLGSITSWEPGKHRNHLEPEERGSWVVLHLLKTTEKDGDKVTHRTGERRRVPLTNVAYIAEDGDDRKPQPQQSGKAIKE